MTTENRDTAFARLHPNVQHHIVNSLRWDTLRDAQAGAVAPVIAGEDTVVVAPTAGGKTEAVLFPVLSRMASESWQGVSVLYVCPLRALLNNLGPRVEQYGSWLGRTAAIWHGDTGQPERQKIMRARPDILLTTPESLESMLVSTKTEPRAFFGDLRVVIVDEVHAFAGDDRGWHLLAVVERLSRIAGRPLQRIGLSATVGNPAEMVEWLQGAMTDRPRTVVAPNPAVPQLAPDLEVDYVGTIPNAARVIAAMHSGEKRLAFVDSRRRAEELAAALRALGVQTHVSHSSLSTAERRRSEAAFADSRDTVIVATSTLELGIDIGDLDRVIQVGPPRTVASFLQRMGRTGRRPGTKRNCLFLGIDPEEVLRTIGMLHCWARGWVEPVVPPPEPRHIAAQQLLALCLQERRLSFDSRDRWWGPLPVFDGSAQSILEHLVAEHFLERDGDLLIIGPEAERRFGHRYFSDLTAVFSAPPEFTVLVGNEEIGTVGTTLLAERREGDLVLLLAGRSWRVEHIDWRRRRCWAVEVGESGQAKWSGSSNDWSYDVARGMRAVLLGEKVVGVSTTPRAAAVLADQREVYSQTVSYDRSIITRTDADARWWTWAGTATNRTLAASFPELFDQSQRFDEKMIRIRAEVELEDLAILRSGRELALPRVNPNALSGLKFSAALPETLALTTLAGRLANLPDAKSVLAERRQVRSDF
ncbi:DEAD/DEAH box helicase [Nocardia sp. NPDC057663]|uniref:DEAD/DEAH box helicase n=1 Tax=Nocardia sp. NPDC057663 TaxID=3346201 RepID=UPI00366B14CA